MARHSKPIADALARLEGVAPGSGTLLRSTLVTAQPITESAVGGPPMPLGVDLHPNLPWHNYGLNLGQQAVARQYVVWNDPGNGTSDWRAGLANLRWVTQNAESNGYRMRPGGQTWSFSACVDNPDTIVDTRALSLRMPDLQAADLASLAPASLAHLQGGMIIDSINRYLEVSGRTVWTIGGNAGQTLAGALATGTHGSFWQRPPITDYVRALTLVTEGGRALWLEPATHPLTNSTFAAWGEFEVVRDDNLFSAAVISLGCLGVVFSVVLEVRPLVYVDCTRTARDFDQALQNALYDNNFDGLSLPRSPSVSPPDHFEVVLNPYALGAGQGGARMTVCYDDLATSTPIVNPAPGPALNQAMIAPLLQQIATFPPAVPTLVNLVSGIVYPDRHAVGPFSITTPVSTTEGVATLSTEIAFARGDLKTVVPSILASIRSAQPGFFFPGMLGIRFTQPSKLPLAFARFKPTCTIEFACMGGIGGTQEFLDALRGDLGAAGVQLMPHWGQYFAPDRSIATHCGADLARWLAARKQLVPTKGRVYGNAFTDALGLTP